MDLQFCKRQEVQIICRTILENLVNRVVFPEPEISDSKSNETSLLEQPNLSIASALESLTEESAKEIFGDAPKKESLSTNTSTVIANFIGNEIKPAPSENTIQRSKDQFLNDVISEHMWVIFKLKFPKCYQSLL